jgi:CelD/BcsL family acetyltransferase involved in cellulose biosynthesis
MSLDPNPLPVSNPFVAGTGMLSVASGMIRPLNCGTMNISAALVSPQGKQVAIVNDNITTVAPGPNVPEWSGSIFGVANPLLNLKGDRSPMALTMTTTARNFPFCVIAKDSSGNLRRPAARRRRRRESDRRAGRSGRRLARSESDSDQ